VEETGVYRDNNKYNVRSWTNLVFKGALPLAINGITALFLKYKKIQPLKAHNFGMEHQIMTPTATYERSSALT
jgi:hypothetical protein